MDNLNVSMVMGKNGTAEDVFKVYDKKVEYIAVYVPSTIYNEVVDNTEILNNTVYGMSQLFGGSTTTEGVGGYVADDGEFITEKVHIVKCFTEQVTVEHAEKVLNLAKWIKEKMSQQCVSVELNGKLMFI